MKKLLAILITLLIAIVIYNQLTTVKMEDFNRLRLTVDSVKRNTDTIKADVRILKLDTDTLKAGQEQIKEGQKAIFETMQENQNRTLWDYLNL